MPDDPWVAFVDNVGWGFASFAQGWATTQWAAGQLTGWIGTAFQNNILSAVVNNPWITYVLVGLGLSAALLLGGKSVIAIGGLIG